MMNVKNQCERGGSYLDLTWRRCPCLTGSCNKNVCKTEASQCCKAKWFMVSLTACQNISCVHSRVLKSIKAVLSFKLSLSTVKRTALTTEAECTLCTVYMCSRMLVSPFRELCFQECNYGQIKKLLMLQNRGT